MSVASSNQSAVFPALSTSQIQSFRSALFMLPLFIALFPLMLRLADYPAPWFDEGYKMNAALTVVQYSVYGSSSVDGLIPFDPGISGGPVDIGLTALGLRLFGIGVVQARLASLVFTVMAVLGLFSVMSFIYSRRVALISLLFMIAFPIINNDVGFLLMGRQVLSEIATLAFISVGLSAWFQGWVTRRVIWGVLAGILIGVGILSKTQVAIALIPALGLVGLFRCVHDRRLRFVWLAPAIIAVGVFLLWSVIGQILTPPQIRLQNQVMLLDAIRSNLITPLLGSGLTRASWLIVMLMTLPCLLLFLRWMRLRNRPISNRQWGEMTLAAFLVFSLLWFIFLSIGWPRYAFIPLIIALLLLPRFFLEAINYLARCRFHHWQYSWIVVPLLLLGLGVNLKPILTHPAENNAQVMADYIAQQVPTSAVIETWEWEMDILLPEAHFHHPHQLYLFEAIRQFSGRETFDLGYDVLQADPDFLIVGNMSAWTGIYRNQALDQFFTKVVQFGPYALYERRR